MTPNRTPTEARPIAVKASGNPDLVDIAEALLTLQEARHLADYDHLAELTKADVLQAVDAARDAIGKLAALAGGSDLQRFFSLLALRQALKQEHCRRSGTAEAPRHFPGAVLPFGLPVQECRGQRYGEDLPRRSTGGQTQSTFTRVASSSPAASVTVRHLDRPAAWEPRRCDGGGRRSRLAATVTVWAQPAASPIGAPVMLGRCA